MVRCRRNRHGGNASPDAGAGGEPCNGSSSNDLALGVREPFRLFFPWAMICGILGASLWLLFYMGKLTFHPGQAHARIMIEGMGGGFIIGFLATALQRMIGAPRFTAVEITIIGFLHVMAIAAHLSAHTARGDGLFALALTSLAACTALRFSQRDDLPPPAFALAGMGLAGALTAAWLLAFEPEFLIRSFFTQRFVRLLLYEGFLLLPVLGVGAFLLPRILRLESKQSFPDQRFPSRAWIASMLTATAIGAAVIGSLALEAGGWLRSGNAIRLIASALWIHFTLPGLWTTRMSGTQAWAARIALVSILLSFALRAALPPHLNLAYALEHLFFVSGIGLLLFVVGARVIDGHSGHRDAAAGKCTALRWVTWLVLLATATRISADFWPTIMVSHHIYAALLWAIVSVIWLTTRARKLATPDPEDQ